MNKDLWFIIWVDSHLCCCKLRWTSSPCFPQLLLILLAWPFFLSILFFVFFCFFFEYLFSVAASNSGLKQHKCIIVWFWGPKSHWAKGKVPSGPDSPRGSKRECFPLFSASSGFLPSWTPGPFLTSLIISPTTDSDPRGSLIRLLMMPLSPLG